jgi:hypothetical protein
MSMPSTRGPAVPSAAAVMSGRPGRVLGDFPVPFEYPRPPRLRFHEAFGHLAGEVSACLRGGSAPARQAPAVEGSARR